MQRQQMIADIERQANAVRRANPQYDDDDMDAIYKIAGSLNGDIEAASDYYQAQQDRIVTNYIARKGKAAPGTAPAPGGGTSHSETPKEFRTTDEAHELAKDWLLGRMGQES
jgi:hypothetical protein